MDVPYIVFILFLLLLSGLYWKNPKRTYFVIAIWVVLFFIGFRSRVVGGADSINYVRFFTGEQNFYNINDTRDLEPLLMAYNAVLRVLLFNNGTLYLFVTTFIGLFFIYKMVDKYSYNKMLSVLFFFFFLEAVLISFDKSVKHDLDECNLYHSFCGFSKEFVIDGQPSEVFQP